LNSKKNDPDGVGQHESFDTNEEIQDIDWGYDKPLPPPPPPSKPDGEGQLEDPSPSNGSVGKLKLTSEMKEKLEAVTGGGSRKNSVKSTTSKEDSMEVGGDPVGKLEEKKKLLIEQKLGADGSLPDPARSAQPPAPIKPSTVGTVNGINIDDQQQQEISNRKSIERNGSTSTHLKHEKYDLEESSEFLQPIDDRPPILVDEDDYQALEEVKTQIHPPNSSNFFTYNRVPWTLKIRKEVFSPSETVQSP
jgi:myosin-15